MTTKVIVGAIAGAARAAVPPLEQAAGLRPATPGRESMRSGMSGGTSSTTRPGDSEI